MAIKRRRDVFPSARCFGKNMFFTLIESMFPELKINDTFQGEYKFCTATNISQKFECFPDILKIVVLDATFSISGSTVKQNILLEIFFSNMTNSTIAVGNYNRRDGQGKLLELSQFSSSFSAALGESTFSLSCNGLVLSIDFIEIETGTMDNTAEEFVVYSANLIKQ